MPKTSRNPSQIPSTLWMLMAHFFICFLLNFASLNVMCSILKLCLMIKFVDVFTFLLILQFISFHNLQDTISRKDQYNPFILTTKLSSRFMMFSTFSRFSRVSNPSFRSNLFRESTFVEAWCDVWVILSSRSPHNMQHAWAAIRPFPHSPSD